MYNEKWLKAFEEIYDKEARGELGSEEALAQAIADVLAHVLSETLVQMSTTLKDTLVELADRRGEEVCDMPIFPGLSAHDVGELSQELFLQLVASRKDQ